MSLIDLQYALQELVTPLDVKIVSLSWTKFNGHKVLELLIDHPDGVDVDLCAKVSELLVETVDRYMIEEEHFYFEVASTGAEQPIQDLRALREAIGAWIHLELKEGVAGITVYEGTLLDANEQQVTLAYMDKTETKTVHTEWDNIKSARYAMKL